MATAVKDSSNSDSSLRQTNQKFLMDANLARTISVTKFVQRKTTAAVSWWAPRCSSAFILVNVAITWARRSIFGTVWPRHVSKKVREEENGLDGVNQGSIDAKEATKQKNVVVFLCVYRLDFECSFDVRGFSFRLGTEFTASRTSRTSLYHILCAMSTLISFFLTQTNTTMRNLCHDSGLG